MCAVGYCTILERWQITFAKSKLLFTFTSYVVNLCLPLLKFNN